MALFLDRCRGARLRLHCRSKQTDRRVHMGQVGAKLPKLLLCSGDHAGDLSPFAHRRRHDMTSCHSHPRSPNNRGDHRRQADMMSAMRLVCLRHDTALFQVEMFQEAVDEVLPRLLAVAHDVDAGVFLPPWSSAGPLAPARACPVLRANQAWEGCPRFCGFSCDARGSAALRPGEARGK